MRTKAGVPRVGPPGQRGLHVPAANPDFTPIKKLPFPNESAGTGWLRDFCAAPASEDQSVPLAT